MMQIIVLLLVLALVVHWKLFLFGSIFYYYFGWPF